MQDKLVEGALGSDGKYFVEFKDGMLRIEASYSAGGGKAGAFIEGDAVLLIDKITDAIPGELDDAVLDRLAEKFLGKKSK